MCNYISFLLVDHDMIQVWNTAGSFGSMELSRLLRLAAFSLSFSLPFKCLMNSTFYVLKLVCFILPIDFFKFSFCLSKLYMCLIEGGKQLTKRACKKKYQSLPFSCSLEVPPFTLVVDCFGIFLHIFNEDICMTQLWYHRITHNTCLNSCLRFLCYTHIKYL